MMWSRCSFSICFRSSLILFIAVIGNHVSLSAGMARAEVVNLVILSDMAPDYDDAAAIKMAFQNPNYKVHCLTNSNDILPDGNQNSLTTLYAMEAELGFGDTAIGTYVGTGHPCDSPALPGILDWSGRLGQLLPSPTPPLELVKPHTECLSEAYNRAVTENFKLGVVVLGNVRDILHWAHLDPQNMHLLRTRTAFFTGVLSQVAGSAGYNNCWIDPVNPRAPCHHIDLVNAVAGANIPFGGFGFWYWDPTAPNSAGTLGNHLEFTGHQALWPYRHNAPINFKRGSTPYLGTGIQHSFHNPHPSAGAHIFDAGPFIGNGIGSANPANFRSHVTVGNPPVTMFELKWGRWSTAPNGHVYWEPSPTGGQVLPNPAIPGDRGYNEFGYGPPQNSNHVAQRLAIAEQLNKTPAAELAGKKPMLGTTFFRDNKTTPFYNWSTNPNVFGSDNDGTHIVLNKTILLTQAYAVDDFAATLEMKHQACANGSNSKVGITLGGEEIDSWAWRSNEARLMFGAEVIVDPRVIPQTHPPTMVKVLRVYEYRDNTQIDSGGNLYVREVGGKQKITASFIKNGDNIDVYATYIDDSGNSTTKLAHSTSMPYLQSEHHVSIISLNSCNAQSTVNTFSVHDRTGITGMSSEIQVIEGVATISRFDPNGDAVGTLISRALIPGAETITLEHAATGLQLDLDLITWHTVLNQITTPLLELSSPHALIYSYVVPPILKDLGLYIKSNGVTQDYQPAH